MLFKGAVKNISSELSDFAGAKNGGELDNCVLMLSEIRVKNNPIET
jgi:hypothetical protein